MRLPDPPPVFPLISSDFVNPEQAYCRHCVFSCDTRERMDDHLKGSHSIEEGAIKLKLDFIWGMQLVKERKDYEFICGLLAERFSAALDSLQGADDFLFEAGTMALQDPPEEPEPTSP